MKKFVLHGIDASPPVRAVLMIGDILNLQFEYIKPDIIAGDLVKPEFIAKNPMKTIPLLEDGNISLSDSHAIVIYLLSKYGSDKEDYLYSSDHQDRAVLHQRMFFDTAVLFPRLRAVSLPAFLGQTSGYTDEQKEEIEDAYGILESYLQNSSYIAGNRFTLADICAGATATSLHELIPVDVQRFPKTMEWIDRINKEKCFKIYNAPGCAELGTIVRTKWEEKKLSK